MGLFCKIGCISFGILIGVLPASGQQAGSKQKLLSKLVEAREEKATYQKTIEGFIKQATPAGLSPAEKATRVQAAMRAADYSKVQPQIEKIYGENFSEAELAYLTSFFDSSIGKKFTNFESRKSESFKSIYMNQFSMIRKIMTNKK